MAGTNRIALARTQAKGGGMSTLDAEQKSAAQGNLSYPKGKKKGA